MGDPVQSLGRDDPLGKGVLPTPVFFPGEFCGQRSLAGYSPWSLKESDTTEQLTPHCFHSSSSFRFFNYLFYFYSPGSLFLCGIFLVAVSGDSSLVVVHWLLVAVASVVVKHKL